MCGVETLGLSPLFRFFVFITVFINFLTAWLTSDKQVPAKLYHCLVGFSIYTAYSLVVLAMGKESLADIVHDLMLCQYYVMVLWTLVLAYFFKEIYSTVENGNYKVGYFRETVGGCCGHIFTKANPH